MRAAARVVATVPLATVALAGLAVLVAPTAPAEAADGDGGGELTVTADGVAFDAARLRDDDGWVSYAVTAPDGSHTAFLGDRYTAREAADGHLGLDVPRHGAYREGWCITWVHLTGLDDQFAGWAGDAPACTTTAPSPSPEPPPSAAPPSDAPAAPAAPPPADPVPAAPTTADPAPAAPAAPEPDPEPSQEPTPTPTPTPPETPTPTASPTPGEADDRPEPARTPLAAAGERGAPPAPAEPFPLLAVTGVGGLVAAAAGGAMLLLRRAG